MLCDWKICFFLKQMQAKKKRLTILYSAYILVSLNPYGGRLAQLVEHLTFNQVVTGSIPVAPTTSRKGFHSFHFPLQKIPEAKRKHSKKYQRILSSIYHLFIKVVFSPFFKHALNIFRNMFRIFIKPAQFF